MENTKLLEVIVKAADDKMAKEIVALQVGQLTSLADFFCVMHANNEKQVQAVTDNIVEEVEKAGYTVRNVEGKEGKKWLLIDCVDVVVHVFYYAERQHYNIENIWSDAPLYPIDQWLGQ